MKILKYLFIFLPISIILKLTDASDMMLFVAAALTIVPLAGLMGEATEVISFHSSPKLGGFLNATFGNLTELIIAILALRAGLVDVVKASMVGSVLGNVLLVLGISMLAGGIKYKTQCFDQKVIDVSSSMLLFAAIGLIVPAIFTHTTNETVLYEKYESFSIIVAVIMLIIYVLSLVFSFVTHKDLYVHEETKEAEPKWSLKKAIGVLVVATLLIAFESEWFVGTVEPLTESLGLSETFVGIIIIPIIGNAAEHSTAVLMAMKNKMNVAMEIALGSSLQIILFVIPVLVLISLVIYPMSIVFTTLELAALTVSILIANKLAADGESNWMEGVQLIAVYIIMAAAFFIV